MYKLYYYCTWPCSESIVKVYSYSKNIYLCGLNSALSDCFNTRRNFKFYFCRMQGTHEQRTASVGPKLSSTHRQPFVNLLTPFSYAMQINLVYNAQDDFFESHFMNYV